MKSFILLAPVALLSTSALVAALPSHPRPRAAEIEARNRPLGEVLLAEDGDYADLSGSSDITKRSVLELSDEGRELVKRKAKKTTTTKKAAATTKKLAAVKVDTKSLKAYSTSSKKAAAAAATSSKKAAAAAATSSKKAAAAAATSSKLAAAAAASSSKLAAAAVSASSVASAKSASLAKLSSTKTTTTTTTTAKAAATTTTTTTTTTVAPSTASPAGTTTGPAGSLQSMALAEHNSFRAQHGAAALSWNATLAAGAQEWANRCVFEHGEGAKNGWGENLSAISGTSNTIIQGIQLWEDEAKDYDPANPMYSHFTQMVWKDSRELGCAVTSCPAGSIFDKKYGASAFYVCEYYPPGNWIGEFGDNVQ